jgi:hypothetical protein
MDMLNKIINITPGSDYQHSGNSSGTHGENSKNGPNSNNPSDSVELSSALRFLIQIGWNLRKLKHHPGDKIELVFFYSGIEFQTIIDISDPNFPYKFDYILKKEKLQLDKKKSLEISLSSILMNLPGNFTKPSELTELNNFFDMLFTLIREREDFPQNFDLNTFLKEFENLANEINDINNYLFQFIEKITETKIVFKNHEPEINEPVVIDKVKIS